MRYMDLVSYDVFLKEKFTYQKSINKERINKTQGAHVRLVRIFCFLLFFTW